jgi:hypothetical protein
MAALALLAACRPAAVGAPEPGASSSTRGVEQLLIAARAQDLQALSAVWGNDEGPVRDRVERQELERRLLIMMCHLRHDESRIGPVQAGEGGRTIHPVELKQGATEAVSNFTLVRNKESGRWFVEDFDMRPLRPFCTTMPPPGGRTPGS